MKIKLNEDQYKQLVKEVGGYDDPNIGAEDEKALLENILKNYMLFRDAMDNLGEFIPGIVVQDRLKNDLGNIRNSLVKPLNNYSKLMMKLKSDIERNPEDDF